MKPKALTLLLAAGALATASLCSHASVAAPSFSALYVFGDSLSDSGNNALVIGANGAQVISGNSYIPTQPYGSGDYSNGPVWVNSFAAGLGLAAYATPSLAGGGDYAFGGARTTTDGPAATLGFPYSAATQLTGFLGNIGVSPSALYVIAVGGNDVRDVGAAVAAQPSNAAALISAGAAAYAAGVGAMVDALQAGGATHIVVWDAPDVGKTPAALATGATGSAMATTIAASFNAALSYRLSGEVGVSIFDVFGAVDAMVANPAAYGLLNVTDACGALRSCNPSQYLFWDGIHPTSAGEAALTSAMLAAVPEPASALMFLAGGLLLLAWRRLA